MELDKTYDPQLFEPHWAEWWVENNVFRADANAPGPIFSIVVPPPNVTGSMWITTPRLALLPGSASQPTHKVEMGVAGHDRHRMLPAERCDPRIVSWNRRTRSLQF